MSAVVGGIVGAIVAALVAGGLVVASDDDPAVEETTGTTEPGGSGSGGSMGANSDIQDLLARVQPTVVQINTSASSGQQGAGSGFVFDAEGLILTNAHVIEGADEISVTFFDGSASGAELVGSFPDEDVAMIRVEGMDGLEPAVLGSSDALEVGEDVVAIGNALGLGGQPTVTTGIVSALNRSIDDGAGGVLTNLIQTDAAINPGNSGGPLLNAEGEVVGINTAKIPDASNIGFALSIDAIRPLIEDLRDGNGDVTADTPFLGVSTLPLNSGDVPQALLDEFNITERRGLIISEVTPGSGAADAGLEPGDVIREVDGQAIDDNEALGEIIRSKAVGDTITVAYDRMGERTEVTVTLGRRGG
jgi:S1-C subfamily serine protease